MLTKIKRIHRSLTSMLKASFIPEWIRSKVWRKGPNILFWVFVRKCPELKLSYKSIEQHINPTVTRVSKHLTIHII